MGALFLIDQMLRELNFNFLRYGQFDCNGKKPLRTRLSVVSDLIVLLKFFFKIEIPRLGDRYLRICRTWNQQSDRVVTWNVILRDLSAANRRRRRDPS
jgi:hypothetical protein